MHIDPEGELWLTLALTGALIDVASQFTSDLITSAIEGEFSLSHWSNYLGAAVGGAVFDGIKNSVPYALPNTHNWESPNVERWYPGR